MTAGVSIYVTMICLRRYAPCDPSHKFQNRSSIVTGIDITCSAVGASAFEILFSGIAALKSFTYSYEGPEDEYDSYEPIATVDVLQKHSNRNVRIIAWSYRILRVGQLMAPRITRKDSLNALQAFYSLKRIRLEDTLFYAGALDSNFKTLENLEDGTFYEYQAIYPDDEAWKIPRLVDIVSSSATDFTFLPWM